MFKKILLPLIFILEATPRVLATSAVNPAIDNASCERIDRTMRTSSNDLLRLRKDIEFMADSFLSQPYKADILYRLSETIRNTTYNKSKLILLAMNTIKINSIFVNNEKYKDVVARAYATLFTLLLLSKNLGHLDELELLEVYKLKEPIMAVVKAGVDNSLQSKQNKENALKNVVNNWIACGKVLFIQAVNYVIKSINADAGLCYDDAWVNGLFNVFVLLNGDELSEIDEKLYNEVIETYFTCNNPNWLETYYEYKKFNM